MKKVKGLMSFLLVAVLLISTVFSNSVFANSGISVEIDGMRVNFSDQQPVIVDGRTLVPVRGVFETLGYNVSWEQLTNTATLSNGVNTVIITVGKSTFTTNGNTYSLDIPAQVINGRTMLPFRAVLESIGCSVDWDNSSNRVIVSSGSSAVALSTPQSTPVPNVDNINNNSFVGLWRWYRNYATQVYLDIKANGTYIKTEYDYYNNEWHESGSGIAGTYSINTHGDMDLVCSANSYIRGVYRLSVDGTAFGGGYNYFNRQGRYRSRSEMPFDPALLKQTEDGYLDLSLTSNNSICAFFKVDSISLIDGANTNIGNDSNNKPQPTPTPQTTPTLQFPKSSFRVVYYHNSVYNNIFEIDSLKVTDLEVGRTNYKLYYEISGRMVETSSKSTDRLYLTVFFYDKDGFIVGSRGIDSPRVSVGEKFNTRDSFNAPLETVRLELKSSSGHDIDSDSPTTSTQTPDNSDKRKALEESIALAEIQVSQFENLLEGIEEMLESNRRMLMMEIEMGNRDRIDKQQQRVSDYEKKRSDAIKALDEWKQRLRDFQRQLDGLQ